MDAVAAKGIPSGDAGFVRAFGEQAAHVLVQDGVGEIVVHLVHRDEHETAEMGTRVRQMRERVERALVQGQQLEL